jgi:hypothetical protein
MTRASTVQPFLPRLDPETEGHPARCRCPRCEERTAAAALARKRHRQRLKARGLELELAAEERRTARYLREQAALLERLRRDERLDVLLAVRRAGRPAADAVAEAERRAGAEATSAAPRTR